MHIKEMVMKWTSAMIVWPKEFPLLVLAFISFRIYTDRKFVMAERVYILDMYNPGIYPMVMLSAH